MTDKFQFKKIYMITYFLKKRNLEDEKIENLTNIIYNADKKNFFPLMIILNPYTFFGTLSDNFVENLFSTVYIEQKKIISEFDLINDIIYYNQAKLKNKDLVMIKKLFRQELESFSLFFENYLLLDLPLSLENIEFFKKDKNPKIYRYKREIEIKDQLYDITEILGKDKGNIMGKEYNLERKILFPRLFGG